MSRFAHIEPDGLPEAAKPADGPRYGFDHYLEQGDLALGRGRFESALRLYGRALEEDRSRPEPWVGQVRALLDMGRPGEASTWLEQAVRVIGETPDLLSLWAVACARCGEPDDALAWSDRAMRAGRDAPTVWLARAETLYLRGDAKVAVMTLRKAHEREPGPVCG